jgi:hypothetical protein
MSAIPRSSTSHLEKFPVRYSRNPHWGPIASANYGRAWRRYLRFSIRCTSSLTADEQFPIAQPEQTSGFGAKQSFDARSKNRFRRRWELMPPKLASSGCPVPTAITGLIAFAAAPAAIGTRLSAKFNAPP